MLKQYMRDIVEQQVSMRIYHFCYNAHHADCCICPLRSTK
jgi:hypothetical protein